MSTLHPAEALPGTQPPTVEAQTGWYPSDIVCLPLFCKTTESLCEVLIRVTSYRHIIMLVSVQESGGNRFLLHLGSCCHEQLHSRLPCQAI